MSHSGPERLAGYLNQNLPAQGFKLLYGEGAPYAARLLADLGHPIICLTDHDAVIPDAVKDSRSMRFVKGSLLNMPYAAFLQAILLVHVLDKIPALQWHALPEVFARALRPGGVVFIGEWRAPGRFSAFRDIDRLMRESGFMRTQNTRLHYDLEVPADMMGAWWEYTLLNEDEGAAISA